MNFAKTHWKLLAGGFVGLLLLYYLMKHANTQDTKQTQADISGGAAVDQNLQAAASIQNNAGNVQQSIAAYQAGVMNNATIANLQAHLADTAGVVAITQQQTAAGLAETLDTNASKVSIQRLQSEQAVNQTALQAQTLTNLADSTAAVNMAIVKGKVQVDTATLGLQQHIYDTLASKGKLGGDSTGVSQILSALQGRGPEAIAANQPSAAGGSPAAILGGIGNIAASLFG